MESNVKRSSDDLQLTHEGFRSCTGGATGNEHKLRQRACLLSKAGDFCFESLGKRSVVGNWTERGSNSQEQRVGAKFCGVKGLENAHILRYATLEGMRVKV